MDKLKKHFLGVFDLPSEITMDLPLMMLVGNNKLFLENHKGISSFQNDEIKVKTKQGYILINGERLSISEIDTESLTISGKLYSIFYEYRIKEDSHD